MITLRRGWRWVSFIYDHSISGREVVEWIKVKNLFHHNYTYSINNCEWQTLSHLHGDLLEKVPKF